MIKIDSCSLIYSLKMDYIKVLNNLYKEIIITPTVFEDVITRGKEKGKPDAFIGEKLIKEKKIEIHDYNEKLLSLGLGKGETEIIQNSINLGCSCLIDDKKAKRIAENFNLDVRNIPISLVQAYKNKIINNTDFDKYLNKWIKFANPSYEEIYYIKKMRELLE